MYNFALAFVICCAAYLIGEIVSNLTRAWIPSVFVTAVVMLLGYWSGLPRELISDSNLLPFGSTIGMYLLLVHMGSVISLRQLAEQWKIIAACLAGLAGMCALCLLVLPGIIGRELVVAGLPPLTGGIIAAVTMQEAAASAGLQEAAVFAIAMYCVQGFAGYPLTALCLQLEGRKLLRERGGAAGIRVDEIDADSGNFRQESRKKLLPPMPARWNSTVMILFKLGVLAWIASQLGAHVHLPFIGTVSGGVWALLLGIAATTLGLLDEGALNRANAYGIVMFGLMMYVFDGLKDCSPGMLGGIIGPMALLIAVGVAGMAAFSFLAARILKMDFCLAFATALTALYGFPPNAVITENVCSALAKTPGEKDYLMSRMFPAMIVGGFVTVTITSVILAGIFAGMI